MYIRCVDMVLQIMCRYGVPNNAPNNAPDNAQTILQTMLQTMRQKLQMMLQDIRPQERTLPGTQLTEEQL